MVESCVLFVPCYCTLLSSCSKRKHNAVGISLRRKILSIPQSQEPCIYMNHHVSQTPFNRLWDQIWVHHCAGWHLESIICLFIISLFSPEDFQSRPSHEAVFGLKHDLSVWNKFHGHKAVVLFVGLVWQSTKSSLFIRSVMKVVVRSALSSPSASDSVSVSQDRFHRRAAI